MEKEFIYIHEEPNVNLLNLQIHIEAFCDDRLKEFAGANMRSAWYCVENHRFQWGPHGADWEHAGRTFFAKMKKDPDFALESERQVKRMGEAMQKAACPILAHNTYETVHDTERIGLVKQFFDYNREMCVYGYVGPIMEMPHEFVIRGLGDLIDRHSSYFRRSREEYIVVLSTPTNELPTAAAHRDLLEIAKDISQDPGLSQNLAHAATVSDLAGNTHPVAQAIERHLAKFPWFIYSYRGPVWTEEKVLEELRHLISLPDLEKRLRDDETKLNVIREQQKTYAAELHLTREEEKFLAGVRSIAYTKVLRKDMLSLGNYMIHLLGRPLWERCGLSFEDIDVYTIQEFLRMLQIGKTLPREEVEARKSFVLYLQTRDGHKVLTGERAREWIRNHVDFGEDVTAVLEVQGTVASLGEKGAQVHGLIKRVEVPEDMKKFENGDILLSSGTTPDLLLAMRRAGAIVTDQGGLTSHAAIVSRELKILCVIGTKIATKVFKDGDHVEVDASKGTVKKI